MHGERRGAPSPRQDRRLAAALAGLLAIGWSSPTRAADTWSDPFPGVRHLRRVTSNRHIVALFVDLCHPGISVRATASEERRRTVSSFGGLVGAQAAINADFFSYADYSTRGLAMHAGAAWPGSGDWPGSAPIAFGRRRIELYHADPTTPTEAWMQEVVSGYPTIVWDGIAVPPDIGDHCTIQHPRTIVGLSADRHTLILVVVDGRASTRVGMSCPEMAALMLELGAHTATSMDGGGSSAMWLQGRGVVNYPSGGSERVVANHLAIHASGAGDAPYCHCLPVAETCNGADDDCDGAVDEDDACPREELTLAPAALEEGSSDVDGDGRADACALAPEGLRCARAAGSAFDRLLAGPTLPPELAGDPAWAATLRTGDVDGDGRADACVRAPAGVLCWRSSGRGLTEPLDPLPLGAGVGPDGGPDGPAGPGPDTLSTFRLADVDGDGRADVCERSAAGLCCARSLGHGFAPAPVCLEALGDAAGFGAVARYGSIRMGDIDGDRRADVCALDGEHLVCWLAGAGPGAGDALAFPVRVEGPAWRDADGWAAFGSFGTIRLADLDGDGRADVCGRAADGLRCHLSLGASFGPEIPGPPLDDATGWGERSRASTVRLGDVDGDGRADVCARGEGGVECWLFTGHGFGRALPGPPLGDAAGWDRPDRYRTIRLADVTGDGRADLCARGEGGLSCWEASAGGFTRLVPGPAWSDAAGWTAPARYASIRAVGITPPAAPAAGEPTRPGDGCACRAGHRPGRPAGGGGAGATAGGMALALALTLACAAARRR